MNARSLVLFIGAIVPLFVFSDKAMASFCDEPVGVELLIADSSDNAVESRFGHSLLRFICDPAEPFGDYILSFEASVPKDTSTWNLVTKGISGNFTAQIKPMKMIDLLIFYAQEQNRGFRRIILRLEPKTITALFQHAKKVASAPELIPNYSFFGFNCARMVTWFLRGAGLNMAFDPLVPADLENSMRMNLIAPWKTEVVSSGATILHKTKSTRIKSEIHISEVEIAKLTEAEIFVLNASSYHLSEETKALLEKRSALSRLGLEQIYNIVALPTSFYREKLLTSEAQEEILKTRQAEIQKNLVIPAQQLFYGTSFGKHLPTTSQFTAILNKKRNQDLIELIKTQENL